MKLNILIFDSDESIRHMLKTFLSELGHRVTAYPDPTFCDLYNKPECRCQKEVPCTDVLITDIRMFSTNALNFIFEQARKGCQSDNVNKAVMSASMTKLQKRAIEELGCHPIKKPFHLKELKAWVDQCAMRIAEHKK